MHEGPTTSRRNPGGGGRRPRRMLLTQSTRTVFPTALPPSRAKHRTLGKLIRSRRPPRQAGNTTSVSQAREPRFREAEHLPRCCPAREGGACSPHRAGLPRARPATPTPQGYREHRGQQSWTEMCAQEQWGGHHRGVGVGRCRTAGRPRGRSGSEILLPPDFDWLGRLLELRGDTRSSFPPAPGQGGENSRYHAGSVYWAFTEGPAQC